MQHTYHSVKFTPLVTLHSPGRGLVLAGAELAEILGGLGDCVGEKMKFDAT